MGDGIGGFHELGANIKGAWEEWSEGGNTTEMAKILTYMSANLWVIWNKIIFQYYKSDLLYAVTWVRSVLAQWTNL